MPGPPQPRPSTAFEEGLAVACLVLLVLITLGNVLVRYLTDASFAWTEEISVFLMVVLALSGASAVAARDAHIRIEVLYAGGDAARRRALRVLAGCLGGLLFVLLAVLFGRLVADELRWGETTMGLGWPRWWFTAWTPLLCIAIALRSFGDAWRAARSPLDDGPAA